MRSLVGLAVLGVCLLLSPASFAHEYTEGTVKIEHPRAAPTPAGAKTGAVYMKIVNTGKEPLEIKGMSTPIAEKVEVHSMTMTDGIMRMRPIALPITIAPGETLKLSVDRHVMLIGLKQPLVEEEMVPFTLEFANGKSMNVDLYVEAEEGDEDHEGH
jgi:periplasmic copper chaperone A